LKTPTKITLLYFLGGRNLKQFLEELSYNLWWTWNPIAKNLFKSIDPLLWEEFNKNPIKLLKESKSLEEVLQNPEFIKH